MAHKRITPAIHIARKHQSAPAEHWADKEIKKAAEEIDAGNWISPESGDTIEGLGLSLATGPLAMVERHSSRGALTFDEFRKDAIATRNLDQLARHPRVVEAIEKMREEAEKLTNPHEAIENAWRLHELNADQAAGQKWEGQERWQGKENEEMRIGQVLAPMEFYNRLTKVIGIERVFRGGELHKTHPSAKSGRLGLYVKNPLYEGGPIIAPEYAQQKAQELRQAGEAELLKARRLRRSGHNAEADKAFEMAGDMAKAATEILMEMSANQQLAQPPFLRVATLQWPLGTEWMLMNFNEYGVPTTAKFIGWRTALLTMMRCNAITEEEAHEAFPVGSGPAASWYLEQLFLRRNYGTAVN